MFSGGIVFQNTSETEVNEVMFVRTLVNRLHEGYAWMEPFRSSGHTTKIHITKPIPTGRREGQNHVTTTVKASLYTSNAVCPLMKDVQMPLELHEVLATPVDGDLLVILGLVDLNFHRTILHHDHTLRNRTRKFGRLVGWKKSTIQSVVHRFALDGDRHVLKHFLQPAHRRRRARGQFSISLHRRL